MMSENSAIIKINEIVHWRMENSKKDVLAKTQFFGLTVNLLTYVEAVYSLDSPSLGEVAHALNVSSASASVAINKLIDSGYIGKQRSTDDKRINNLHLTKKGERLINANKDAVGVFVDEINSVLTEKEKEAIEQIYMKLKSLKIDEDTNNRH